MSRTLDHEQLLWLRGPCQTKLVFGVAGVPHRLRHPAQLLLAMAS